MRLHSISRLALFVVLTAVAADATASNAAAGGFSVTITDPTGDPVQTWVTGNMQAVTWTFTGVGEIVKYFRVKIVNSTDNSTVYLNSGNITIGSSPQSYNFTVPSTGAGGDITSCTILVDGINSAGGVVDGGSSVAVKINNPG